MTACSSSSSGGGDAASNSAQSQSAADLNANENDVQVLNSLQLNTQELDSAFATDSQWKTWTAADPSKILLKQTWACTQNMIDTSKKSLEPVTSYFMAGPLPNDPAAPSTPTSTSTSTSSHTNSYKNKGSSSQSSPTSTGSSGSGSAATTAPDGNPVHWVVSTAIAYQTADAAQAAVAGMGAIDPKASGCGDPKETDKEVVGGGGEVLPSWLNSQGVFVFTDTHTHVTIAAVAQRRGRYVVLTYTRGSATATSGYYDLEQGPDTRPAAAAATAVLGQLTSAVVGAGS